ncbi:MAG: DNA-processing protein DprA [Planctomycetes bacterium]|nr:DNA-processing protein DprA [Planctomycetota bacterium]
MEDPQQRRRNYIRLNLADGIGAVRTNQLIEHFGSVEEIFKSNANQLQQIDGIGPKLAHAITSISDDDVEKELALAEKYEVQILCIEDADYPAALKRIYDPPPVLYVRGQLEQNDTVALAIVGARRCSHYGLEQSGRFASLLVRAGFTIVSGGARGIDAAAHRGALAAGGRTIAVMGCGLAKTYPPENKKLFDEIVSQDKGAIISELPMSIGVKGQNFPKRNRIIAGLALGVLVVEASTRSGALITAKLALEQGKEVFAIPGKVDSPFSSGTNALIAKGSAALVSRLEDILENLDHLGEVITEQGPIIESPARNIALNEKEAALLKHLSTDELSLDELIRRSRLSAGEVSATMTILAIKGLIIQQPDGKFAANRRT